MSEFKGFPRDFFRFFRDLAANNQREWFNDNKPRYQASVVEPMCAFISAMAPRLKRISPHYVADPKPHGGSMFRIYRDTRFSKDKTPYKTHAACHFRHEAGKDAHAPGFYAHFERDRLYFGGGVWRPPGPHLAIIREAIVDNPTAWSRIVNGKALREQGGLQGDGLKRPPRGFDPEHRHVEDLKRKSFYVMGEFDPALVHQAAVLDAAEAAFRAARPLNRFITESLGLPF